MKIAALGDINIDVVLTVDRLPAPGEEVFSSSRRELLGGSAVNTAVVLSRLRHEVAVMGWVGDDEAGLRVLTQLRDCGISTDLTGHSYEHPTAMNTILVTPDGERTMIGARGANVAYRNQTGWHEGLDWLHISGYALMAGSQQQAALQAVETANSLSISCSIDVPGGVGGRIRDALGEMLGAFTIAAGSQASLREFTGSDDPIRALIDRGVTRVAVTSGADPLVLADSSSQIRITPPRVAPVDATGAGDALVAGLISAHLAGLKLGPAAALAAATGAAATLAPGASSTLKNPDVWPMLLDEGRWSDIDPTWLDEVATLVGYDTTPGSVG